VVDIERPSKAPIVHEKRRKEGKKEGRKEGRNTIGERRKNNSERSNILSHIYIYLYY